MPSGRLAFAEVMHIIISVCVFAAAMFGAALDTPAATIVVCVAILLFGLPHGTFDLALIRQAHADQRTLHVVALYLGCAALMFALWQHAPSLALLVFFGLSIAHFAEDWADRLPSFLAHGTAVAVLTAPALLHRDALEALFAMLAGNAASGVIVAVGIVVAPVSLAAATVGILALWHDEHRTHAATTGLAVVGMVFLPPVIGFALFFCLMHSPAHFTAARRALGWYRPEQWVPVTVSLTGAALFIAGLIFVTLSTDAITSAAVVTAFITLSVLTLPHIAAPMIITALSRYRTKPV